MPGADRAPQGISWLPATTLNFPPAVCSSASPRNPARLSFLSPTSKFLSPRCFKPLRKAWRITGSTMVVTLQAGAEDLEFFFLAFESNLAVPCTAGFLRPAPTFPPGLRDRDHTDQRDPASPMLNSCRKTWSPGGPEGWEQEPRSRVPPRDAILPAVMLLKPSFAAQFPGIGWIAPFGS